MVQNLLAAFEELSREINISIASEELKSELIDVTNDCRAELEKAAPNRTKFIGLLGGLATSIQTDASLRGAWDVFNNAAVAFGIVIA